MRIKLPPKHLKSKKPKASLPPVASAPGTLPENPNANPTKLHITLYDANDVHEARNVSLEDFLNLKTQNKTLWLDVVGLKNLDTIRAIGERFGLHPLALEDVVTLGQRPKAESYEIHSLLIVRMPVHTGELLQEQVSIFVGDGFVISFQEREGDCFDAIRRRLRDAGGRMRAAKSDYLAYALMDAVTDSFFPIMEGFAERLENLEAELLLKAESKQSHELHAIKRDLTAIRRTVWPMRDMLNSLIRDDYPQILPSTKIYLRDTYDHAFQLMDLAESYRESSSSLLDLYLSMLSQRMNEIMKVLTIISTIFIPLGFLAGLWGMNFDTSSPLNMPELGWRYGYPIALGFMGLIAACLLVFFWRKGWIGRG